RGLPLRDAPGWVTALLVAAGVVLPCIAALRLGALGVALTGLALLAGWAVAAQLFFDSGRILDFADPAAALLLATAGTALVGLWFDKLERRRLREQFAAGAAGLIEDVLSASGPRVLEPTAIIAGYRIEAVVGRGGMGVVYRASQLALERPV